MPLPFPDSVEGILDGEWVDDDWTNDGSKAGVNPIVDTRTTTEGSPRRTRRTTSNPLPVREYSPGIGIKSMNPTAFACTRDEFYFAPHPTDCQKYFVCSHRELHEHQCGDGIQWDFGLSQCEFVERAVCFSRMQQIQHETGPFFENRPANQEVDHRPDGVEGIIDPDFGIVDGTIDRNDPAFVSSEEKVPLPLFPDEIDSGFAVAPGRVHSSEELDADINVRPIHPSGENDTEWNWSPTPNVPEWADVPDSNDSSNSIEMYLPSKI